MLETGSKQPAGTGKTVPLLIAAGLALVFLALGYLVWQYETGETGPTVVLTDEARAYLPLLDLADVEMTGTENTLGQTLIEITGKIGNLGEKPIRSMRLNCVFFDVYGIELHRVLSTIVRADSSLPAGDEREFRLAFDAIPNGWNQVLPSLYIAEIHFE